MKKEALVSIFLLVILGLCVSAWAGNAEDSINYAKLGRILGMIVGAILGVWFLFKSIFKKKK